MRARIQFDHPAPRPDPGDESLYQDGMSVPDNLVDLAACLDSLLRQGDGREAEGLTYSPEARRAIREALVSLRRAASQGLSAMRSLKCACCGIGNAHGFSCSKCCNEVTR